MMVMRSIVITYVLAWRCCMLLNTRNGGINISFFFCFFFVSSFLLYRRGEVIEAPELNKKYKATYDVWVCVRVRPLMD